MRKILKTQTRNGTITGGFSALALCAMAGLPTGAAAHIPETHGEGLIIAASAGCASVLTQPASGCRDLGRPGGLGHGNIRDSLHLVEDDLFKAEALRRSTPQDTDGPERLLNP